MAALSALALLAIILLLIWRTKLACLSAMRRIEASLPSGGSVSSPLASHLYLLLPALREQSLVNSTLDHFESLMNGQRQVSTIVITSDSEQLVEGSGTTTADLVDNWLSKHPFANVQRLHDPRTGGSKATKLNFAVGVLVDRHYGQDPSSLMIGIYDFDSRPMPGTLQELAALSSPKGFPPLAQQVPYPIMAIDRLPPRSAGRVLGIGHLERALALEGERYRQVDKEHQRGRIPPFLRGCMGAGLFIRADILIRAGGFPPASDDITLGYRLDLLGVRRQDLVTPNLVEPPPTAVLALRQMLRIYRGVYTAVPEAISFEAGIFPRNAAIGAALNTHLRDAEPSARLLLAIAALIAAWSTGSTALLVTTFIAAWALHLWLFSDLVRYGRWLVGVSGDGRLLTLHPLEWAVGPIAQGLLRLVTWLGFTVGRLARIKQPKIDDDSTPRIDKGPLRSR